MVRGRGQAACGAGTGTSGDGGASVIEELVAWPGGTGDDWQRCAGVAIVRAQTGVGGGAVSAGGNVGAARSPRGGQLTGAG